jgi:hypothetical protein
MFSIEPCNTLAAKDSYRNSLHVIWLRIFGRFGKKSGGLGGGRPNSLFFAGDLGQRIFQQAFSWKSLGADVRGRSTTLHINFPIQHEA